MQTDNEPNTDAEAKGPRETKPIRAKPRAAGTSRTASRKPTLHKKQVLLIVESPEKGRPSRSIWARATRLPPPWAT